MKHCLIKPTALVLMVVKAIATIAVILFPQMLMELAHPFVLFSPLLLAAFAYTKASKLFIKVILISIVLLMLSLFVFFLIDRKKKGKILPRLIQGFLFVEVLSYLLSLLFGSLVVKNILGILFNGMIILFMQEPRDME